MEAAYDHIQEEAIPSEPDHKKNANDSEPGSLNTDLQDAYKSFSSSAWGTRIGGFLATARKQGESYIAEGRNQATQVGGEAFKGFTDLRSTLVSRARSMSQGEETGEEGSTAASAEKGKEKVAAQSDAAIKESEGIIARLKAEAAQRLKDIQKAEDAADEALLKFGANIKDFLRDAVTIAPPEEGDEADKDGKSGKVLFESKDTEGKRVIHTTRFDAQLHVIHCSLDSFTRDPASPEWEKWKSDFDVKAKTEDIAKDLEAHEELRRSMEKVVPEKVDYETFWKRYYFLRMVIESEDKRRKEILKGATQSEEVAWDEDSDDEPSTPQAKASKPDLKADKSKSLQEADTLKPNEPRKSDDKISTAGSDASYDLVSGTTSKTPGSPKEEKSKKKDDSEDEDWE